MVSTKITKNFPKSALDTEKSAHTQAPFLPHKQRYPNYLRYLHLRKCSKREIIVFKCHWKVYLEQVASIKQFAKRKNTERRDSGIYDPVCHLKMMLMSVTDKM